MTDKPETPSQRMNRLIRETPAKKDARDMLASFRRTWANKKENSNG